jgi:hypothetical protein
MRGCWDPATSSGVIGSETPEAFKTGTHSLYTVMPRKEPRMSDKRSRICSPLKNADFCLRQVSPELSLYRACRSLQGLRIGSAEALDHEGRAFSSLLNTL